MSDHVYPIVRVSPDQLSPSPHQPDGRTAPSIALNALKKSIAEQNLQYPPLVVRKAVGDGYTVVDGHRRIEAMKLLGWQEIPVLVSRGRAEDLFSAVSGTTKPVTASQWIQVYLRGGDVPPGSSRVNIKRLDAVVGREFLQKLADSGLSPQIWSVANRAIAYAGIEDENKAKVLNWLLENKIARQVSAWITGDSPAKQLREAFEQNRAPVAG